MTKNKRKKNRRILLQDIMSFIFTSYRIKIYFKISSSFNFAHRHLIDDYVPCMRGVKKF